MSRLTSPTLTAAQPRSQLPQRQGGAREPAAERGFALPSPSETATPWAKAASRTQTVPVERPDGRDAADRAPDRTERRTEDREDRASGRDRAERARARDARPGSPQDRAAPSGDRDREGPQTDEKDAKDAVAPGADQAAAEAAGQPAAEVAASATPPEGMAAMLAALAGEGGPKGAGPDHGPVRGGKLREVSARTAGSGAPAAGHHLPGATGTSSPEAAAPQELAAAKAAALAVGADTGDGSPKEGQTVSAELGTTLLASLGTPDAVVVPGAGQKPGFAELLTPGTGTDGKVRATQVVVSDVSVGRVPIEIGLKSLDGVNRFEIRLTPEELGRVEVRLDIDESGQVKAHLVVDRPEALALLTRDRSQLERAFEQAGLRPSDDGIAFSLRDGSAENGGRPFSDRGQQGDESSSRGGAGVLPGQEGGPAAALPHRILSRLGALDLRI